MHPPIKPGAWDHKLDAFSRKAFIWFVVPAFCILFLYWWYEKCGCEEHCTEQGGQFVELETGGRFDPMWVCVCEIKGLRLRTAQW